MTRNIKFLVDDIKEATVSATREASVQIMNGLAQDGPAWTGKFSSAWYALPEGGSPGGHRSEGQVYNYQTNDVPITKFRSGVVYRIVNGMEYADQALDLVPFDPKNRERPLRSPIGSLEPLGTRPLNGRRGELLNGSGQNRSTAPLDWFPTYTGGGRLKEDLGAGVRKGFDTYKPPASGQ